MQFLSKLFAVAAMVALVAGSTALAAGPDATKISVEGMHCPSCAKKIVAELKAVSGVADVKVNVKEELLTVSTKPKQNPSPRALWEAIEKAGYKPVKLEGPFGIFKEKPKA